MDKDLLKGLGYLLALIGVLVGIFLLASDSGSDKARCIARALKDGVAVAKIDQLCHLREH